MASRRLRRQDSPEEMSRVRSVASGCRGTWAKELKHRFYDGSDRMTRIQIVLYVPNVAAVASSWQHCCSSVAKGGRGANLPPIGLKSMQNTPFLALLRPIFALKTKIAPPPLELEMRIGHGPDVNSTTKTGLQSG